MGVLKDKQERERKRGKVAGNLLHVSRVLFLFRRIGIIPSTHSLPQSYHTYCYTHRYTHTPIGSLSSFGSLPDQFGQLSVGGGRGRGRGFAYGAVRQPKTVGGLQQSAMSRQ